jgi:AbiV family abortive infection protein
MIEDKRNRQARREQLSKLFSKPIELSADDKQLLAELVRGAEVCFANAEQLFQEASLLREHKHFSRSLFLHQIAMEECAKVDLIGTAATGLTMGHPVDLGRLTKAFRDHKAKNFTNAYMAKASEAEIAANEANDKKAAIKAFRNYQREIHGFLNDNKNASMYVDFKDGKFVAPDDVVSEELALQIAAVSYYFMSVTHPRLRLLRRMLDQPNLFFELMPGFDEAMDRALGMDSIEEMKAVFSSYMEETARAFVEKEKDDPKAIEGGSST